MGKGRQVRRPRPTLFTRVLHGLALVIGVFTLGLLLYEWVAGSGAPPRVGLVITGLVFILWGLAEVVHPRLLLFSFSMLFLGFAVNAIETGEIQLGHRAPRVYLETSPGLFSLMVAYVSVLALAAGAWTPRAEFLPATGGRREARRRKKRMDRARRRREQAAAREARRDE